MADKILSWCGNAVLATLLVLLSTYNSVWAQENEGEGAADESGVITVPLSGTATTTFIDSLDVSENPLDFGLVEIGNTQTASMTLSHVGTPDSPAILINDAVLTGKSQNEFTTDFNGFVTLFGGCLLYTSPSPRDQRGSRMPSSA